MNRTPKITIPAHEYELTAIRSSGPGGQHVNKVATAIQLRFDIRKSSLSEAQKVSLLAIRDQRLTQEGEILIKVEESRSQQKNREIAVRRLHQLIQKALHRAKKRIPTQPTKASVKARIQKKKQRSDIKKMRGKIRPED